MSEASQDLLPFLLNMLQSRPSVSLGLALSWSQSYPVIYSILNELDQLYDAMAIPTTHTHSQEFLEWIKQFL